MTLIAPAAFVRKYASARSGFGRNDQQISKDALETDPAVARDSQPVTCPKGEARAEQPNRRGAEGLAQGADTAETEPSYEILIRWIIDGTGRERGAGGERMASWQGRRGAPDDR